MSDSPPRAPDFSRLVSEISLPLSRANATEVFGAKVWGAWPSTGTRVLMLHGWLDNAATYDLLAPKLVAGVPGATFAAVDFAGHGRSSHRPPGTIYHFIDYVYDVIRAADALGWADFHLMGHSLGAAVGSYAAALFPDRVTSFAALEGLGPITEKPENLPKRLKEHFAARKRLDAQAANGKQAPVYRDAASALATRMIAGEFPVGPWIQGVVDRALRPERDGVSWRSDARLRLPTAVRMTDEQVLSVLGEIACPVIFIRASSGIPIDPALLQRALSNVKNLTTVEMAGGHHVHLEHPEPVAQAVLAFWARQNSPRLRPEAAPLP